MVGTKSSAQVGSYKRRFLRKYPVWATFSDPPSVATTSATSKSNTSPLSGTSEGSESPRTSPAKSQLSQESPENQSIPPQDRSEAPPVGEVSTPSPSLSVLLGREQLVEESNRPLPPGGSSWSRALLEEADKAIKMLRGQPTEGGVEGLKADSPISQSMDEKSQHIGAVPARPTEEVLQILDILVSTPSPSQREQSRPAVDIPLRSPNPRLGDELDWETPLPLVPLQCTEDRPPVPGWGIGPLGWPYGPLSPAQEFSSHPVRSPGPRWPYSPLNSPEKGITNLSQRNSQPNGEFPSPFSPPTQTPIPSRYGPDYALRDYLQGHKGGEPKGTSWPYSPISPSSPGPGPTQGENLRSSMGWMDSQKSGKGKSPVGRKGINKGKGGRGREVTPTQRTPEGGSTEGIPRQLVKISAGGHPGGVQALGEGYQGGAGPNCTQGIRGLEVDREAQTTPTVPPHRVERGNLIAGETTQWGHREHARAQNPLTTVATPNPTPHPTSSIRMMNKDDDQAPHKLFNTIRHLTGRVLSPDEWGKWCQVLDKWTAGLAQWALDREKSTPPQQAWSRRQLQKRQRDRGPWEQGSRSVREGEAEEEGTQPERNRAITKRANLQRLYNRAPRKCMESIRHSSQPKRCEVSVTEVEKFFKAKYEAPLLRAATTPPPFPLWDHPKGADVLQSPITLQELKAIFQRMDGNTSPGPDRIGYRTWKQLEADHKMVLEILNTCRTNGKIPPEWKSSTTILIHKGEDPSVLDNWRPIALQNTLYKVYAAVVAGRISAWAMEEGIMSTSQKGFLPMEGCLEHNHLMSSVLQDSRRRKRPIVLSWLDLKDAYGLVPHHILFSIMGLAGLNGLTLEVVRDFYHQTTTSIRTGKDRTGPITIKRGVKQGCPLSPILFNLVMEGLIRAAEATEGAGYKLANSVVKSLAYADDLCLFASTPGAMQGMLDKVQRAGEWAGLTFSPRKCATLSVVRSQRARQRVTPQEYHLGPTVVPSMRWEDRYKYLGIKTGAGHSSDLDGLGREYASDVGAIMKSDLTDWQKIDAVHRFAKPRLVYALQNQLPPINLPPCQVDGGLTELQGHPHPTPQRLDVSLLAFPLLGGGCLESLVELPSPSFASWLSLPGLLVPHLSLWDHYSDTEGGMLWRPHKYGSHPPIEGDPSPLPSRVQTRRHPWSS